MSSEEYWHKITTAAEAAGWTVRAVDVACLDDVRTRVNDALGGSGFSAAVASRIGEDAAAPWAERLEGARSVVVGAIARPLTRATLTLDGRQHTVPLPPHYAGYETTPDGLTAAVASALAAFGGRAVRVEPPLKTLAAGSGLARYGRNNIAYVPGLGSYLQLAACLTDVEPPAGAAWGEALRLDRCERCSACLHACPTGAIRADRFLLETDRCLTWVNESLRPLPSWVEPGWHTCAVGCLRCQQACPENAVVELTVAAPEVFDAQETAAILRAAALEEYPAGAREKLRRSGLDYGEGIIARNLRVLIEG